MFDYNLRFETEQHANEILSPILDALHLSQYVRYDIGQIKNYEYDEANLEAEPVVTIVSNRWHVDLRLRTDNGALAKYQVFPNEPIHNFS